MTIATISQARTSTVLSHDGTVIAYQSIGHGPGLVIVGGVLSSAADYLPLARALAEDHEVHVMQRRGRPGSGRQRPGHGIEDECADLAAVVANTGAIATFGHSFGGLVALETARRGPLTDELFLYEPGAALRGQISLGWLDGYSRLLEHGDRRGAFAWMVKHNGYAPRLVASMPLRAISVTLRLALRGSKWETINELLECNLVEHRVLAALDAPDADRFSTIAAPTCLLGGAASPDGISGAVLRELASVIPDATVRILAGLGHPAPIDHPTRVATAMRAASPRA